MGNALTSPSRLADSEAVSDLQGVTYKDSLGEGGGACRCCWLRLCCSNQPHPNMLCMRAGGGRFFKSALCVHDDGGLVVVKVRRRRRGADGLAGDCWSHVVPHLYSTLHKHNHLPPSHASKIIDQTTGVCQAA